MLREASVLTSPGTTWTDRQQAIEVIVENGGREEIDYLIYHLTHAIEPQGDVCEVILRMGTHEDGQHIWQWTKRQNWAQIPEQVFHLLGYLGVEECTKAIWTQARGSDFHWRQREACFGLAHLTCDEIRDHIYKEIKKCLTKPLFQEYVPMLASKTGHQELAQEMLDAGSKLVSTDCNAGLVLGLALMGEVNRFRQAVLDPNWESMDTGTGTIAATILAVQILGRSIIDWWFETEKNAYTIEFFVTLLGRIRHETYCPIRFAPPWVDSPQDLHNRLIVTPGGLLESIANLPPQRQTPLLAILNTVIERHGFTGPTQNQQ